MIGPDDDLDRLTRRLDVAIAAGDEDAATGCHAEVMARIREVHGSAELGGYQQRVRGFVEQLLAEGRRLVIEENFSGALATSDRARMTALASGAEDLQAAALGQAGYALHRTGHQEEALSTLETGRKCARRASDPATLSSIEINIGLVLVAGGRHSLAELRFDEALRLARSVGVAYLETNALNNRAYVARQLGRLEEAEAGYREALRMARQIGAVEDIRAGLVNLGFLDQLKGDLVAAQSRYEEAHSIAEAGGDRQGVRMAIKLLAGLALNRKDFETAEKLYVRVLESAAEVGDRDAERSAIHQLSYIAGARGEDEKELERIEQALRVSEESGDYRGRMMALSFLGAALRKQGKLEEARSVLEESLELVRDDGDIRFRAEGASNLGEVLIEIGDVARGIELLEEAVDIADTFALSAGSERAETEVFASAAHLAVDFAVASHRHSRRLQPPGRLALFTKAHNAVERARGRDLRRALLLPQRLMAGGVTPEDVATLERLTAEARASEARWRAATRSATGHSHKEQEAKLRTARQSLAAYRRVLQERHPEFQNLFDPGVPSTEEVEASLAPNQAILSFALNEQAGVATVFVANGIAGFETPGAGTLRPYIRSLAAAVSNPAATYMPYGHTLFLHLITPALRLFSGQGLEIEDLFIIPDGDLHLLPFSLLLTEAPGTGTNVMPADPSLSGMPVAADNASLRTWLSSRYQGPAVDFSGLPYLDRLIPLLRVVPSLDLAVRLARDGRQSSPERFEHAACLIGDPIDSEGRPALDAAGAELEAIATAIRSTPSRSMRWKEADLAGHTLVAQRCTRDELLKSFARRSSATRPSFCYVHFATHGVVNDQHPELSGLMLSQTDGVDDVWRIPDILANPFEARLVVASACNTARGHYVSGSGVSSLTRAFLLAGARSVVSSLWSVPDGQTAELMGNLYMRMAAGEPPGHALSAAAAELRGNPDARPYHWAGFVTSG